MVVIGPIPGRAVLTRGGLSRPGTRSDAFPCGLWECLAPVSSAHAATGSAPCGTPRIPPGIKIPISPWEVIRRHLSEEPPDIATLYSPRDQNSYQFMTFCRSWHRGRGYDENWTRAPRAPF